MRNGKASKNGNGATTKSKAHLRIECGSPGRAFANSQDL